VTDDDSIRIDKWLWQARFFKTRGTASRLCAGGRVRVAGQITRKAHYPVRVGDVLTFPQARRIRVVRVVALGTRRGPAPEAALLYDDMSPDAPEMRGERPHRSWTRGSRLPGSRTPW
jgi:ribosome-associated heat shock protein Hsp15